MSAFECKYSWKNGYSYSVPAATVGAVLTKIEKKQGAVTSEAFLDYSRNEDSETHNMFEWDDTIAAEKFRLSQARWIINQIEVEIVYDKKEPEQMEVEFLQSAGPINSFVNVETKSVGKRAVYHNVVRAMQDDNSRKVVLRNALYELNAFKNKYRCFKEFAGVIKEIKKVTNEQIIT